MYNEDSKIHDAFIIINRYKNIVKQKIVSTFYLNTADNEKLNKNDVNNIIINFNDSLFDFLNRNIADPFYTQTEYIDEITNNNEITNDDDMIFKILYSNDVNIFVRNDILKTLKIIENNFANIICLNILEEYYGKIEKYEYIIQKNNNIHTIILKIKQNNTVNDLRIINLIQMDSNVLINNINFSSLFYDKNQLENINNTGLLSELNIKRLNMIFEYVLNNNSLINPSFFSYVIFDDLKIIMTALYNLYIKINLSSYTFSKEEFTNRIKNFCIKINSHHNINQNILNNFIRKAELNTLITIDQTYYNDLRNVDLDNNSTIYNYVTNIEKYCKVNKELYNDIIQKNNKNKYKEYNNYVRDVTYKFSKKYNKLLFYDGMNIKVGNEEINVYLVLENGEYLKDFTCATAGTIITLLSNVLTVQRLDKTNINNKNIIHIKLYWYNIFLFLQNYGVTGIILPYGTQLMIKTIQGSTNYIATAVCINKIEQFITSSINDFIRINRTF